MLECPTPTASPCALMLFFSWHKQVTLSRYTYTYPYTYEISTSLMSEEWGLTHFITWWFECLLYVPSLSKILLSVAGAICQKYMCILYTSLDRTGKYYAILVWRWNISQIMTFKSLNRVSNYKRSAQTWTKKKYRKINSEQLAADGRK